MNARDSSPNTDPNVHSSAISIFLLFLVIGASLLLHPEIVARLSGSAAEYPTFDLGHYLNLARTPRCWAFYPLWPKIINLLSGVFSGSLVRTATIASTACFIAALILALKWLTKNLPDKSAALITWRLYLLSPMTVFMFIGYSEALFALLSWTLLSLCSKILDSQPSKAKTWEFALAITAALIGYCRPSLPQTFAACSVALAIQSYSLSWNRESIVKSSTFRVCCYIVTGGLVGYAIYGGQCIAEGLSFFEPFRSQTADWDKSLGFRPLFFFTSRSPIVDLWGVYYPSAIFLLGLSTRFKWAGDLLSFAAVKGQTYFYVFLAYPPLAIIFSVFFFIRKGSMSMFLQRLRRGITKRPQNPESQNSAFEKPSLLNSEKSSFLFFFCATFSSAHSAIVFLTQENYLYSLGRYIFGQPYFYVSLGLMLPMLLGYACLRLNRFGLVASTVSACYLYSQFAMYSQGKWIG